MAKSLGFSPTRLLVFSSVLLSGGLLHAQSWTPLKNQPSFWVANCLLLTDASVICQELESRSWHKFSPDNFGSYINGAWSPLASLLPVGYAPYAGSTAVLADGRALVVGGEYN